MGQLPVLSVLPELAQRLGASSHTLCALEAPPGSGKTILAPLWLQQTLGLRRALVLVPKRVNARLPVLFLEGCCGDAVGYRIRFESRWNEATVKAGYLTYGTAIRSFADDPPGVDDLVIFDEFHERPWEADLLLAYLRGRTRQQGRGPRLLVMSASLESAVLPAGTPLVRSDGRLYPVEISRETVDPMLLARPERLPALVAERSAELARYESGEQLIFLPGLSTIRAVEAVLRSDALGGAVDVLHSSLPEAEIRRVVERPVEAGFRRILSTDLAESSVTLPGVTTVIDAGLQRRPQHDAFALGITLRTVRAPLSSLLQRAGRAGRLRAGCCHRLLTHQDELHREPFAPPEISRLDGKTLALALASLGQLEVWPELPWLVPPEQSALAEAAEWLAHQNLLRGGGLNSRGRQVLRSACSARCGLFGVLAREAGWPTGRVVDWVYALESGPPDGTGPAGTVSDLLNNARWMASRDSRLLQRLRDTFSGAAGSAASNLPAEPLLLQAFSDTLVELRGDRALPRQAGVEALLLSSSHPPQTRYAVALATVPAGQGGGPASRLSLYQPISEESLWETLLEDMSESSQLIWESKSRSVRELRRTTLGALVLEEETRSPQPGPEVAQLLRDHLSLSELGDDFLTLARRLSHFMKVHPELAQTLGELETTAGDGEEPATVWLDRLLLSYLATVTRWSKSSPGELQLWLEQTLGYATMREMEQLLPSTVRLPGRQRPVPVVYPEQGSPYVASKLQDFFGWKPPRLLNGQLALACHLLAPSGRPVQITEDLEGFWKGSYQQVRKDLRGRYPKHAWPEKPE
jgi:ATP-dependent helicase HrpB